MKLREFIAILESISFESFEEKSKYRKEEQYSYFGCAGFAYHNDTIMIRSIDHELLLASYNSNEKNIIDDSLLDKEYVRCKVDLHPYLSINGYHDSASTITFYVK